MTSTFIIKETQNLQSEREGSTFKGTLTSAKRHATKNQCFHGTTLKIESQSGTLICFKKDGSVWQNA